MTPQPFDTELLVRMTTEIAVACLERNPLDRSEVSLLIHDIQGALGRSSFAAERADAGRETPSVRALDRVAKPSPADSGRLAGCPAVTRSAGRTICAQRLHCEPGGWSTLPLPAPSSHGQVRHDARRLSTEMGPSGRLSDGCAKLCSRAIGHDKADWVRPERSQQATARIGSTVGGTRTG